MKTYTICGGMRFDKDMKKIAYELETSKGYNILQCFYCEENVFPTKEELLRIEVAHYRKIDLSDGIYVVNIDGYIGESVKKKLSMLKNMARKYCIITNDKFNLERI